MRQQHDLQIERDEWLRVTGSLRKVGDQFEISGDAVESIDPPEEPYT